MHKQKSKTARRYGGVEQEIVALLGRPSGPTVFLAQQFQDPSDAPPPGPAASRPISSDEGTTFRHVTLDPAPITADDILAIQTHSKVRSAPQKSAALPLMIITIQ